MPISPKLVRRKKKIAKRQLTEQTFIRNHPNLYIKYRNQSWSHDKAIMYAKRELSQIKVKKGTKSLEKLKHRYQINVQKPGIQSISIEDIPRTKAVDIWIQDRVYKGDIIDMGYQLKFPRDESLRRY